LIIEKVEPEGSDRLFVFEVRWRPEVPIRGGVYRLVVRDGASQAAEVSVPVLVRADGEGDP
jgi:hypothetical protein